MSTQQMFNDSVLRIVAQGKPAFDDAQNSCQNLTEDGRRCAVGVLIPPNRYEERSEVMDPVEIYNTYLRDLYPDANPNILIDLRDLHDNLAERDHSEFVRYFVADVRSIACEYGLTMPDDQISKLITKVKEW